MIKKVTFAIPTAVLVPTVGAAIVLAGSPLSQSSANSPSPKNQQLQTCRLPQIIPRRPSVSSDPTWLDTVRVLEESEHTDAVFSLAFSPDGQVLATGSRDGKIKLWTNLTSKKRDWTWLHNEKDRKDKLQVTAVAFSPQGSYFADMSVSGLVRVWDWRRATPLFKTRQQLSSSSLVFSPDGKFLFSGGIQKIQRWRVDRGRLQGLAPWMDEQAINSIAFSPDGKLLATGGKERPTIDLWDVSRSRRICTFGNHLYSVKSVAFSPDGTLLASAGADSTIQIWSLQAQEPILLQTLKNHTQSVNAVTFSPSGKLLLSGGRDGKVKLWQVRDGRQIFSIEEHSSEVLSVAFRPDGKGFAVGSRDGVFRTFFLNSQ